MNPCPAQNYFGTGPVILEEVQHCARVMNEIGRYAPDHGVRIGLHNEFFCAINLPNHRELIESTDPDLVHYCIDAERPAFSGMARGSDVPSMLTSLRIDLDPIGMAALRPAARGR